jgi:hypothetical protein
MKYTLDQDFAALMNLVDFLEKGDEDVERMFGEAPELKGAFVRIPHLLIGKMDLDEDMISQEFSIKNATFYFTSLGCWVLTFEENGGTRRVELSDVYHMNDEYCILDFDGTLEVYVK